MSRQSNKPNKRAELLPKIAEAFGELGYRRATTAAIAARCEVQETTLYRMVAAYSMFANGGERVEPTLVDRVQDGWGGTVYRHNVWCRFRLSGSDASPSAHSRNFGQTISRMRILMHAATGMAMRRP